MSRPSPPTAEPDCPEQVSSPVRLHPPAPRTPAAAPSLSKAVQLHDKGDLEGARAEATALLDSLQDQGIDSLSLRFLIGTWALEAEDGLGAEAQFEIVAQAGADLQALAERSSSQLRVARTLAYGADAVALAEVRELFGRGLWAAAEEQIKLLFLHGEDGEVLKEAEAFRDEMRAEATQLGSSLLAELEALLSGAGPYDGAAELLARVEELPAGTWNSLELVRLRDWYQGAGVGATEGPEVGAKQSQVLDEARALVAEMDYRAALERFAELEGTSLQVTARMEAVRAVDTLVKEERVRAGRLFVAARKEKNPKLRLAALAEVQALLAALLKDYPQSKYAKRVRDNLASVEQEVESTGKLVGAEGAAP